MAPMTAKLRMKIMIATPPSTYKDACERVVSNIFRRRRKQEHTYPGGDDVVELEALRERMGARHTVSAAPAMSPSPSHSRTHLNEELGTSNAKPELSKQGEHEGAQEGRVNTARKSRHVVHANGESLPSGRGGQGQHHQGLTHGFACLPLLTTMSFMS